MTGPNVRPVRDDEDMNVDGIPDIDSLSQHDLDGRDFDKGGAKDGDAGDVETFNVVDDEDGNPTLTDAGSRGSMGSPS